MKLPELPDGCEPTLEHLMCHMDGLEEAISVDDWMQVVHEAHMIADIARHLEEEYNGQP